MNTIKALSAENIRRAQPFTEEDQQLARQTIIEAMSATKTVRSRGPNGKITYVTVPDWAIRLPAAVKAIEFVSGRPLAMSVTADLTPGGKPGTPNDVLMDVLADPEAAKTVRATLDKMIEAAEKAKPVDVTVTDPRK